MPVCFSIESCDGVKLILFAQVLDTPSLFLIKRLSSKAVKSSKLTALETVAPL